MIVNHNMSAINAHRYTKFRDWDVQKSMAKLASGMRINSAADDATGLAVSEKMRTQIRGLRQAERNVEDGMSFVQTAEGFMEQTTEMLQRVRQLSIQAANGIYTDQDRVLIQVEVSQLVDEIQRISEQAEFNRQQLLTGKYSREGGPDNSMFFHMGANKDQREAIHIRTMTAKALGLTDGNDKPFSLSTPQGANELIGRVDDALAKVVKTRGDLGAYGNRLEVAARSLMNAYENVQASESRIRDTDMAEEMVEYIKSSILMETGTIMLAHANLRPQSVLKLLSS